MRTAQALYDRMETDCLARLARSDAQCRILAEQLERAEQQVSLLQSIIEQRNELIAAQQHRLKMRGQPVESVDAFTCKRICAEFGHYVRKNDVAPADYYATLDRLLYTVATDADNIYHLVVNGALAYGVDEAELQDVLYCLEASHCS